MTDQVKEVARPWRSYLRFSVRGLIVLVLVIGAWMGWLVRSARIQRDAVTAISREGGTVRYEWGWTNGGLFPGGETWTPIWLVDLIGVDYFGKVTIVDYPYGAQVSDAGLAHLKELTKLSALNLEGTQVSDAGLAHLKELTQLSILLLDHTRVTDAGLVHLKGLTKLSLLRLDDTRVTDAGLVHLKGLSILARLDLGSTQVTDAGMVHLTRLTTLRSVDLGATRVTNAGLTHLQGLNKLSELYVNATQVNDAGMKELRQALPGLTIYH